MDNKYFTYLSLVALFILVFIGCSHNCNCCKCEEQLRTHVTADDMDEDFEVLPKMGQ